MVAARPREIDVWASYAPHADWGRDAALWLGQRVGRLRLGEPGALAGGMDYAAVGQAVPRFNKRLAAQPHLSRTVTALQSQLSHVQI